MLTLSISHNIFLSHEQIVSLATGQPVEAVGVSVPVWFYKGNTSEPAKEVFCKYKLTNVTEDYPVTTLARGYKINLPQVLSMIRPDNWSEMSSSDKSYWRQTHPSQICGLDLLDLNAEETFHFKRYTKLTENGNRMNLIHAVEIGTFEILERSFS
jgi:hypothetical protein